ncbi:MAG TPA: cytochrome d ubiquinol oxidase subunit II [Spirochaetia bacterium]|nr:cytochrome d ubiquinol oxidase subunit II [Spirochaetia bacterium]
MTLQVIWFVLWGLLWAVYFMLDGFDLGSGMLYNFLARNDTEKRMILGAVGPVWNGNEVWLVTAGGATFAAFPGTYAAMFSFLYLPLLFVLYSLILRGVSLEFRGKIEGARWKKWWDTIILIGSFIPALLFGVAFGNIFQGLQIDASGYHGTFFGLLNFYGLLTGILFVVLFLYHAALWLVLRTGGELSERAAALSTKLWYILAAVAVVFLIGTAFFTNLYANFVASPGWFVVPFVAVAGLVSSRIFTSRASRLLAFLSSCATVLGIVFTGIIGLFPRLLPSALDPASSLTIFNSSSSAYTLRVMTIVAFIFVPIIVVYQILVYRFFRKPVTADAIEGDAEGY